MTLLLPDAINLVNRIIPTCHFGHPLPVWYEPNDVFDRALIEDRDVWWVGSSEHGHPFVPPGFVFSRAIRIADVAARRLSKRCDIKAPLRTIYVLEPSLREGATAHPHTYFRRGEFVEIEPVPFADALREPRKMARHLREFFQDHHPDVVPADSERQVEAWRRDLKALHSAAGLPANSKKRWVQITVSSRRRIGQEWYWPLQIARRDSAALARARQHAEAVDAMLVE